jgi:hypothetical protein
MTNRRLFSLEEANALLPQLESILSRLTKKKEAMDRMHDELFISELLHEATQQKRASSDGDGRLDAGAQDVDERVSELEADLAQIKSFGCILRNLDAGWVEFPANFQGEVIYFCWKKGEPAVGFYRQMNSAFTERLPYKK